MIHVCKCEYPVRGKGGCRKCGYQFSEPAGSAKITQRQLESILINEGIIQAAAIENPEGYDGGRTELAMTIVTQQINELLSPNDPSSATRELKI